MPTFIHSFILWGRGRQCLRPQGAHTDTHTCTRVYTMHTRAHTFSVPFRHLSLPWLGTPGSQRHGALSSLEPRTPHLAPCSDETWHTAELCSPESHTWDSREHKCGSATLSERGSQKNLSSVLAEHSAEVKRGHSRSRASAWQISFLFASKPTSRCVSKGKS